MLSCSVREIIRKGESEYKDLNLDNPNFSEDELLTTLSKHPKLLERPIVVNDDKAAIGRPPENVLNII